MRSAAIIVSTALAVAVALPSKARAESIPSLPELRLAQIPPESRQNYVGDRFSYMEAGPAAAPAVVLFHGVGANSAHWRFQLAGLSDRFHVVAWNAPGYMVSDNLNADMPSCKDFADAANDFLTALK